MDLLSRKAFFLTTWGRTVHLCHELLEEARLLQDISLQYQSKLTVRFFFFFLV